MAEKFIKDAGGWEEYRLHQVKSIEWLLEESRRQHDKILAMEVKLELRKGNTAIVISIGSSILASLLTYIITHKLIP